MQLHFPNASTPLSSPLSSLSTSLFSLAPIIGLAEENALVHRRGYREDMALLSRSPSPRKIGYAHLGSSYDCVSYDFQ